MTTSETRLRAWGNSIGLIVPKSVLREEGLSVNDEVEVTIRKKSSPLASVFGRLQRSKAKPGKSTAALLREIDQELGGKAG